MIVSYWIRSRVTEKYIVEIIVYFIIIITFLLYKSHAFRACAVVGEVGLNLSSSFEVKDCKKAICNKAAKGMYQLLLVFASSSGEHA